MKKIIYLAISFLYINSIYSQKAKIFLGVKDSLTSSPSDVIFQMEIKNVSFDKYWVQDTSFLRSNIEVPNQNLIHPYIEKSENGRYKSYSAEKYGSNSAEREKYLDTCYNCIYLNKGESLKMNLPILSCCRLEKGMYRISVSLSPPLYSCNLCSQLTEITSNYVYLNVQ